MKYKLNNKLVYQIFVRNYSSEGKIVNVTNDLEKIKGLGFDIIYLLPIHPIGIKDRKGVMGSPYSIRDYKAVSPDLGTLDDFKELIRKAHQLDLKIVMDIVFHHTSRDAIYLDKHPDWYVYKEDGRLGNKVGDWSDIADFEFDHNNEQLETFLISVLEYWSSLGVDGYRCDVASLVPLSFWLKAKNAIAKLNKDSFLIGESVERSFLKYMKDNNYTAVSDNDLYKAFEGLYDYDVFHLFKEALKDNNGLKAYIDELNIQRANEQGHLRLRFLENHDQPRIAGLLEKNRLLSFIKLLFLLDGPTLIYAGQELGVRQLPNLFEKDPVDFTTIDTTILSAYKEGIKQKKELDKQGINVVNFEFIAPNKVIAHLNKPYINLNSIEIAF